jgi:predicted HicB family RNase H-like nuclease
MIACKIKQLTSKEKSSAQAIDFQLSLNTWATQAIEQEES